MTVYLLREWDWYSGHNGCWSSVGLVKSEEVAQKWIRHGTDTPDPDRSYKELPLTETFYDEEDKRTYD